MARNDRSTAFGGKLPSMQVLTIYQAINYLKASRLARGLILNFGARSLEYRRVVLSVGAVM